jgi:hypothetical protein
MKNPLRYTLNFLRAGSASPLYLPKRASMHLDRPLIEPSIQTLGPVTIFTIPVL